MAGGRAKLGQAGRKARCWLVATVGAAVLAAPVGALAAQGAPVVPPVSSPVPAVGGAVDPARVAALAARIRNLLERTGSSSAGAITARLSAELGASGGNCATVKAALAQVDRKGLSAAALAALDGVAASANLCAGLGTGAITQGQTLSQPTTLGLPGGSSNYQ